MNSKTAHFPSSLHTTGACIAARSVAAASLAPSNSGVASGCRGPRMALPARAGKPGLHWRCLRIELCNLNRQPCHFRCRAQAWTTMSSSAADRRRRSSVGVSLFAASGSLGGVAEASAKIGIAGHRYHLFEKSRPCAGVSACGGCPLRAADSTGQGNTLAKTFCRYLEAEGLPWTFVQSTSDGIKLALTNIRQVHPLWEVLAQQTVGVLVGATLPRPQRVGK